MDKEKAWFSSGFTLDLVRKVGSSPRDRMRWLACDFAAHTNFDLLSPNETPESLLREVVTFVLLQNGASLRLNKRLQLPKIEMEALAVETRAGLESFIGGHTWTIEVRDPLVRRLHRHPRNLPLDKKDELVTESVWSGLRSSPVRTLFLIAAHDLLVQQGEWLARCPFSECLALFVKEDPRQIFCSRKCADNARIRSFREREQAKKTRKTSARKPMKGRS